MALKRSASYPFAVNASVAAAGSAQNDAAAVLPGFTAVTASDDAKGVVLPTATKGMVVIIKNTVANKVLKIYPATDAAINAVAANGSYDAAAAVPLMLIAVSATQWYTVPLLGS